MLPPYVLSLHQPAPPAPLTLTVNAKGRLYPSKALLERLGIRNGQPMSLLPPSSDCPSWQLDLRPTARGRIRWHENTQPRVDRIGLPAGIVEPNTRVVLALANSEPTSIGLHLLNIVTILS
jgi:hypothetical protein